MNEKELKLLTEAIRLLEIAMEHDEGDVFRKDHNAVVDFLIEAREVIQPN